MDEEKNYFSEVQISFEHEKKKEEKEHPLSKVLISLTSLTPKYPSFLQKRTSNIKSIRLLKILL